MGNPEMDSLEMDNPEMDNPEKGNPVVDSLVGLYPCLLGVEAAVHSGQMGI